MVPTSRRPSSLRRWASRSFTSGSLISAGDGHGQPGRALASEGVYVGGEEATGTGFPAVVANVHRAGIHSHQVENRRAAAASPEAVRARGAHGERPVDLSGRFVMVVPAQDDVGPAGED